MKKANDIVLKALGFLLIFAGGLKGWQLLTEPVANNSIWNWRPFMVLQFDFELALGIWLLSSMFKKAAWLAAISCFSLFSAVTLYKGITDAKSCGCFGIVDINPWITLFAIDLPAVIALALLRQKGEKILSWPTLPRFATSAAIGLITLGITTPILAFNELAKEYIEVDYPELLIKTCDVWQFACLEVSPARFSFIDPNSLIKTASNYGFDNQWLLENVPIAKSTLENRVITNNITYCL